MRHKIFVGTSFYIHIKKSYRAVKFGYKVIIMIERSTMCGKHVSFWLVRIVHLWRALVETGKRFRSVEGFTRPLPRISQTNSGA